MSDGRTALVLALLAAVVLVGAGFVLARMDERAEAHAPHPVLDFAIGVDVDGDGTNDCGTGVPLAVGDGAPDPVAVEVTNTNCVAEADAKLAVNVYLMDNGGLPADGSAAQVYYSGLTSLGSGDAIWTGCVFEASARGPNFENVGCGIGLPPYAYPVSNLGALAVFRFSCTQGGSVSLGHSLGETGLTDSQLTEHREGGRDELSITCGDRTPATGPNPTWTDTPTRPPPTATPCDGACPTATPTRTEPTPTACSGCPAPQFAIGVDVDADGLNDCGSGVPRSVGDGAPDAVPSEVTDPNCHAEEGVTLAVNVYLLDTDGLAYAGAASHIIYTGLDPLGPGENRWSGCVFNAFARGPGWENAGCSIGLSPNPPRRDAGLMTVFGFTCSQGGFVSIGTAVGQTELTTSDLRAYGADGGDPVQITCGDLLPTTATPNFTPTPTSTRPAPCESACPLPHFALGLDVDGDGTNDCGSGVPLAVGDGAPDDVPVQVTNTECVGTRGQSVIASVYLMDAEGMSYSALAATLYYEGLASQSRGVSVWDGCEGDFFASRSTFENAACNIRPLEPDETSVGLAMRFVLTCADTGNLRLGHGLGETYLLGRNLAAYREADRHDELTVTCAAGAEFAGGDSNCSGATNSVDAMLILQYGAKVLLAVQCAWAADVNHDGRIDAVDAALVLQQEAGLLP